MTENRNYRRGRQPRPLEQVERVEQHDKMLRPAKAWDFPYDGSLRDCLCRRVGVWWSIGGAEPTLLTFGCDKQTRKLFAAGHATRTLQRLCMALENGCSVSLSPSLDKLEPHLLAEQLDLRLVEGTERHYRGQARKRIDRRKRNAEVRLGGKETERADRVNKLL